MLIAIDNVRKPARDWAITRVARKVKQKVGNFSGFIAMWYAFPTK